MSKFTEYLEGTKETSKTNGKGISQKDLKILRELERNKDSFDMYIKEGRLPNYVNVDRSKFKHLPDISIGFKDKNYPPKFESQIFEDINCSSFHLTSKKDIEELISILTKLKKLECLK